jgi:uncharacterized membrane protein SirB2
MTDQQAARSAPSADGNRVLRVLALVAVVGGVLLLAAAAFVLSYAGIHLVALSAGVSPRLARIYPLIFDAMLIVAGAAVLALRGAGFFSRIYAWLSMLALLAAAAGADTLHATGTRLPRKPAAASAAIIPWALVLIGFGLLLCLLRHARLRKAAAAAQQKAVVPAAGHVELRPGRSGLPVPRGAATSPARLQVPAQAGPPADQGATEPAEAEELAIDTEPGYDDPASDEGTANGDEGTANRDEDDRATDPTSWSVRTRAEHPVGGPASAFSAAPTIVADDPEIVRDSPEDDGDQGPEDEADGQPEADAGSLAVGEDDFDDEDDVEDVEDGPEDEDDFELEDDEDAGPASPFDRVRSSPVPPEV